MIRSSFIIVFALVVISSPYDEIDYDRINVYTISKPIRGIEVMLPEDSGYDEIQEQTKKQETIYIDYSDLYFLQRR